MSKRNIRLRKRIVRLFQELDSIILSTRQIEEGLKNQITADSANKLRKKVYTIQPTINQLSNILKKHPEFKRTDNEIYIRGCYTGPYVIATWELSDKGREMI